MRRRGKEERGFVTCRLCLFTVASTPLCVTWDELASIPGGERGRRRRVGESGGGGNGEAAWHACRAVACPSSPRSPSAAAAHRRRSRRMVGEGGREGVRAKKGNAKSGNEKKSSTTRLASNTSTSPPFSPDVASLFPLMGLIGRHAPCWAPRSRRFAMQSNRIGFPIV